MKKRRAAVLCAVSLLCLGIFLGRTIWDWLTFQSIHVPKAETVMGIRLVEDFDFLKDKEKKETTDNFGIAFEKIILPYDKASNTLYLSQSLEQWTGTLSVLSENAYILCSPKEDYWSDRQSAVREGHIFTLWAVSESDYYEYQLVISGMPVISIDTERIEEQEKVPYEVDPDKLHFGSETLHYGTISVFNPDVGVDNYEILQSNVCYHLKGDSTKLFDKKGYAFKLQDYQGKNIDVSLLGMRADNSWKLNALNVDASRVREISASRIWQWIDTANTAVEEPGPRMEYAELLLDGEYAGLYLLVEPVDEKKLNLKAGDYLYKTIGWQIPTEETIQESVDSKWKIQTSIRIRYPKIISDYAAAWQPINDYLNMFHRDKQIDYKKSIQKINLDNFIDYYIFSMTVSASDNTYKNIYYTAYAQENGSYQMYQIPWDLDLCMGNISVYAPHFSDDYTKVYTEPALSILMAANAEEIKPKLLERWQIYRESFLNTDAILALFEENRHYILETGAMDREINRWPQTEADPDISSLVNFQTKRMEWLDEYFTEGIK